MDIPVYQLNIKLLLTCYTLKISDVMNKCMPKFYVLKSSDAVAHIWLYYTKYFMQLFAKVHLGLFILVFGKLFYDWLLLITAPFCTISFPRAG